MSILSTELVSCRIVKAVLNSQFSKLSDAASGSLSALSDKMFEKNLISEPVKNDPEFNKILCQFMAGISLLETTEKLEATLEMFLDILRDIGGPLEIAASRIKSSVEAAMKEERSKQLQAETQAAVRNTEPHSSQNRQLEEAHMFVASAGSLKDDIGFDSTDVNTVGESFHALGDYVIPNDVQEENGTTATQFTSVRNGNFIADPKNPIVIVAAEKRSHNSTLVTDSDTVHPSLPVQQGTVPTQVSRTQSSPDTQVSVRGTINHHNSNCHADDCNTELSSLRVRFEREQREKINELKQKVEELEAEKKICSQAEWQKLDDGWKKLRCDQQVLENREKQFEEDRLQRRKSHNEEEDYLESKRKEYRYELDAEKCKLHTEYREKLNDLERIKVQQQKQIDLKMNKRKKALAESTELLKAEEAKDKQLLLKKQEQMASFEGMLQETESKLNQERFKIFQTEKELKDLHMKLETREIQLRGKERFEREKQLEAHGEIESKQARLDEKNQELKAKWNDYWKKEKQFSHREKSLKRRIVTFENEKNRHNQDLVILIVVIAVLWVFTWAGTIVYYNN